MNRAIEKKRVSFRYRNPEAATVFLSGSFNGWNTRANPMKKNKDGIWSAVVNLVPGIYEYRYIADSLWKNDPTCDQYRLNRYGSYNCVLNVPE